jgi:hypothetical protein
MATVATIARYAGTCRCGARVINGDTVRYDTEAREIVRCPSCRYVNIGERRKTAPAEKRDEAP